MFTFIPDLLASESDRVMQNNGVRVLSNEDVQAAVRRLQDGIPFASVFEGYHLYFFTSFVPWLSSTFLLVPVANRTSDNGRGEVGGPGESEDAGVHEDETTEDDEEETDSGMGDRNSDNTGSVANASDFDFDEEDEVDGFEK